MLGQPGTFRNVIRIEPMIFLEHIAQPLVNFCRLPRGYLARTDYALRGHVQRMRRSQVNAVNRILRYVLRLRGVPTSIIAWIFDQDPSTITRDFHHIGTLVMERLAPVHLTRLVPGSAEYLAKRGAGAFRHFPNAVMAVDVVKVAMRRPYALDQDLYCDGHKREHNFGFLCGVDSDGICTYAQGHQPGSINDIQAYYEGDLRNHRNRYLLPGDRVLADGIFARVEGGNGPFIVPVCYLRRALTLAEARFNEIQAWDRSIVEHFFGRLKNLFPVLYWFPFRRSQINVVFIGCVTLCNIVIKYQHPLRK